MELVEGTALRSKVGAPVEPGQLAQIGHQIARALAAAHSAGIIHRDIKPENIILRTDGYVKVLDFGLARRINSEAQTSTSGLGGGGTVRYMSPEQIRGAKLTGSTDVFSLGLVLYELATGSHPFASASLFETGSCHNRQHAAAAFVAEFRDFAATGHFDSQHAGEGSWRAAVGRRRRVVARRRRNRHDRPHSIQPAAGFKKVDRRFNRGDRRCLAAAGVYWWRNRFGANSPMRVLLDKGEVRDPVFSPDGSRIAFSWKPPGAERFHLAVITTGGGEPSVIAAGGAIGMGPAWSPDGKRICFARQGFGENALYVKALRDGAERRVMTLSASTLGDLLDWVPGSTTVVVADTSLWCAAHATGSRNRGPPAPAYGAGVQRYLAQMLTRRGVDRFLAVLHPNHFGSLCDCHQRRCCQKAHLRYRGQARSPLDTGRTRHFVQSAVQKPLGVVARAGRGRNGA